MIYDCHLHTEFSGDSNTPISLQIEKAIELGMKEMCITDHHDYDSGFCDCDFILDIPTYLTSLRMLQAEYRDRIRINIGIELGLQDHLKEYLDHFVKRYGDSFDFIIGSSHFVKSMDFLHVYPVMVLISPFSSSTVRGHPIGQPIQISSLFSMVYASSTFIVIFLRPGCNINISFWSFISSISPGAITGRFLCITCSSSKYTPI